MDKIELKRTFSNFLQKYSDKGPYFVFGFAGLMFLVMTIFKSADSTAANKESAIVDFSTGHKIKSADTYIPAGKVLIPIELTNAEGLDSIIGAIGGTIDLYSHSIENNKKSLVLRRVKILRAPLNPQQYAVLVDEGDSSKVLDQGHQFYAAIHNPKTEKTEEPIYPQKSKNSIKIEISYQEQ